MRSNSASPPRQSCIVVCGSCGARHESSDEYEHSGESWNLRAQPTPALQAMQELSAQAQALDMGYAPARQALTPKEAVALARPMLEGLTKRKYPETTGLEPTPARQEARTPLTEEQIAAISGYLLGLDTPCFSGDDLEFARAIERAHGIGKDEQ